MHVRCVEIAQLVDHVGNMRMATHHAQAGGFRGGGLQDKDHMGPKAGEHEDHTGPRAGEHEDHTGPRAGEHEDHTGPRAGEHEDHTGPRAGGFDHGL